MQKFLNAGFGEPLGADLLAQLKSLGVQGIRQDFQAVPNPVQIEALSQEVLDAGLALLAICASPWQVAFLPPGTHAEYQNEQDGDMAPLEYAEGARLFITTCLEHDIFPWIGAISNLDRDSLDWLGAVVEAIPPALLFGVTVHRYARGNDPLTPHPGFAFRAQEVERLRQIIGPRPFAVSEFGFTTGPRRPLSWWRRLFGKKDRWTDQQVADFARWEWGFWLGQEAVFAAYYQLNDAPSGDTTEGCYGIRRVDGSWKQVAETF